MMITVLKSKYNFKYSKEVIVLTLKIFLSLSLCLFFIKWLGYPNAYYAESVIVLLTITYSLFELNKRINLKGILINVKTKLKR